MATELAKAYVQILPSADGMKGNLASLLGSEAEPEGRKAGNRFASGMKAAAGVGLAAFGATAGAALGLGNAVREGVGDLAAYGDNVDKMSQKMGLSAEAYQEWDFIMQHSGTSIDAMSSGMKKLVTAAETGNKAFDALGISQEQIAGMSQEELFGATLSALQNVEDETQRTYLASQLLGRGATELGALLNLSAEDTEAMRQQAHELGGVLSDDAVKGAAAYQDSLQNLQTGFAGLKNSMLSDFLPSTVQVMDGITGIMTGSEDGVERLQEGVNGFADNLLGLVPRVFEIGLPILTALGTAVVDNLPTLLSTGAEVLGSLAGYIMEAMPTLIPAAVETVTGFAVDLTSPENIKSLLDTAFGMMGSIGKGLIDAIPTLITNIPQIIINIVDAFFEYDWGGLGMDIIGGIADGVMNAGPALLDAVGNAASGALGWAADLLGIHSPSKVFADKIGRHIPEGIAVGVTDNMDPIHDAMDAAARESLSAVPVASLRHAGGDIGAAAASYAGGRDAALEAILRTLETLTGEMAQTSIVLDDGTLVGKLAPRMDSALGVRQRRAARS